MDDKEECDWYLKRCGRAWKECCQACFWPCCPCCPSCDIRNKYEMFQDSDSPITSQPHTISSGTYQRTHTRDERIQYLERQIRELESEYKGKVAQLERANGKLAKDNNALLTRLSEVASAKLTDNNPNIADLSDENRPTKLSENFSELYDNEYTNAFDELDKDMTDRDKCVTLFEILKKVYLKCREKATKDLEEMKTALQTFEGTAEPAVEMMKSLKEHRKKHFQNSARAVEQEIIQESQDVYLMDKGALGTFVKRSVTLCWLMAIQDPPVFIDVRRDMVGAPFDNNAYRPYTASGPEIDFVVWPPIYINEGGAMMTKGVAQGKKEN